MRRLLIACACLTAFLAGILRAQDDRPEVRSLRLAGVENVDRLDLEKSIWTRASNCRSLILEVFCLFSHSPAFVDRFFLDEDELRRDVLRIRLYYWKRGYRETAVDTAVRRTGVNEVAVTFTIHEGHPTIVRRVVIVYDSALISPRARDRLTLLHPGDPLDLVRLDSMRVAFQNDLWDQGFGDAVADTSTVVDTALHAANVRLTVIANRRTTIGKITVTGNKEVDTSTILRSLSFQTGDLYRQTTVLESQRNLYESNLFRLATIYVPPQHDTVKNVNVGVTEAPLHEARVGPGFTNIEFLQLQAHYTILNLFGGARRLDLDALAGNLFARSLAGRGVFDAGIADVPDTLRKPFLKPTYSLSVDFRQPAFLRRASNLAAISASTHRTINPGVFVDRGYGGAVTFTHEVRPRAPLSLSYRYELNRVRASDTYFCVNYGVCDTLTIQSLRSRLALSPATFTGFVDRSDQPYSPTKGYVARFDLEHASAATGSNYRYHRLFLDAAIYTHTSGSKRVYSAHGRFGVVRALGDDVLHPRKRFYAGGANSVRGYAENQLGPRVLTIEADTLVRVARSINGGLCAATVANIQFCDPNSPGLASNLFLPQPLGGTSLLEGSIEFRAPLPFPDPFRHFVGAVFIDGGIVGGARVRGLRSISGIIKGTGAITPGVGIRYMSTVGPIRVDLGVNPNRAENLGVVTAVIDTSGTFRLVALGPARRFVQGGSFLNRLALHFSIGEAF